MPVNLNGRKVQRFRATIDPMIPPRPRNAFDRRELSDWRFEMTPAGIYVFCPLPKGRFEEHVIPYNNIQSLKLYPEAESDEAPAGKKSEE